MKKYIKDRQAAFARLSASRSLRSAKLGESRADGKRQRDEDQVKDFSEHTPSSRRLKEKTVDAEMAIAAEMKALEKSKDADMLVSRLRAAHDALVHQYTQSATTAAASAQPYVPCAFGLAGIAAKEREREMLLLSVSEMKTSCKAAVDLHAHRQSLLLEATRERAASQTEVDEEKTRLQDLLLADDGVGIVASATRLQHKIAQRDAIGDKIPELTQQDKVAGDHAATHQMLAREADLMCEHLDGELAALQQTMDAARDLCTGSVTRLTCSNETVIEESRLALEDAISYQQAYSTAHHDLFMNLSIVALKHMLRVTYGAQPSGNERADLRRDIQKVRERAAENWKQLYDPSIIEARYQHERDEVAAKSKEETDGRSLAYLQWAQRAGMLTSDATGASTEQDGTDYEEQDVAALNACRVLQILPAQVCYTRQHTHSCTVHMYLQTRVNPRQHAVGYTHAVCF
jgi:hypothetical protein